MASGHKTLHEIDRAISRARKAVDEAHILAERAARAMADVRLKETAQYAQIARDRLDLIAEGGGRGSLGYVDRQAKKHLSDFDRDHARADTAITKARKALEKLESDRRIQEDHVNEAVNAYDKAAAAAEKKLLSDPEYNTHIARVDELEAMVVRATEKQALAETDEVEKGKVFLSDPFFTYLQSRRYGTEDAKGWFLTKALDGWVAGLINYRQAAENYRRLTAIPVRLTRHVERLQTQVETARDVLEQMEANKLVAEGATALHEKSLKLQTKLDVIDDKIDAAEAKHTEALLYQERLAAGETGPLKTAIESMTEVFAKTNHRTLQRLTAQTTTLSDDKAMETLRSLSDTAQELADDHEETRKLSRKYRETLKDLEKVRKRFKSKRFDAPSSDFVNGLLVTKLLGQVLAGALDGDDFWKQLKRLQRTLKRYSDYDFGGVDWTEGLRLPRPSGRHGRVSIPRTPTFRLPRSPRVRTPHIRKPRIRTGGFRTGGGFGGGGGFRTGGGF